MTTLYPNQLDNNLSLPLMIDGISPVRAGDVNRLQKAIVAIQKELGTNPSGTAGTVSDRLTNVFKEFFASEVQVADTDGYYQSNPDGYLTVEDALSQIGAQLQILIGGGQIAAASVSVADADGYFDGTNVEAALKELYETIQLISPSGGVAIGEAEDASYADGLFTDFVPTTPVGTAVDRFNEVLKNLAPPAPPAFANISWTSASGPTGNVSFDASHAISGYQPVDGSAGGTTLTVASNPLFVTGGQRRGVFAAGQTHSGLLAGNVGAGTGNPTPSYPAGSFVDGDQGTLQIFFNGSLAHSSNLTQSSPTLSTGDCGFTLSASTPVSFPNGDAFSTFRFRTGTWFAGPSHERAGHNYLQIKHVIGAQTRASNFFEWIVDTNATTTVISSSNEVLDTLVMAVGSPARKISGIEYHVSGTARYDVQIQNIHRNTYSASASAISHPGALNCSTASTALGTISSAADTEIITDQTILVNSTQARILNGSITVNTLADRTVQTDVTSAGKSIVGLLLDTVSDGATQFNEPFDGEKYRLPSNFDTTAVSGYLTAGSRSGGWDSSVSLASATAGYTDGALVYNGGLYYPAGSQVAANGNFTSILNGPANNGQPGGANPNYSGLTGIKTYIRYFVFSSLVPVSNFVMALQAVGTPVIRTVGPTTGTNQFCIEFALPGTTTADNATFGTFKDAVTDYSGSDLDAGCFAGTYGNNKGNVAGAAWGISFGGRNTGTSGSAVLVKLTIPQGWTGSVANLQLIAAT